MKDGDTLNMATKNVTLSADESLIHLARLRALQERRTLNYYFRKWLETFVGKADHKMNYQQLAQKLSHIKAGRHFARDVRNER